ncbi:Peptidyl-prolyl cis-trans isomerase FKBP17-1, chloroplastic [Gracilariopsis chorda]|uniref:peptidylprolyl isomerase n=1 Tax=Gracilariopsis chorda TaxID=448386 RepID=A0A2V3IRB8_9FLOR|nr:Peptidyl-prolyl cis-trans isomerase FKBP17-1, chloroplastic [Gracilariopsis chorda]|eukprot:PXF43700.1 Peptidyl-prolyl cis-trans isomerase FKBP17-1, chloroplastic [Gracilariopsis chorda]
MNRKQLNFCIPHLSASCRKPQRQKAVCRIASSETNAYKPPRFSRRAALAFLLSLPLTPVLADDEIENRRDEDRPLTGFQTISGLKFFDFTRGEGPTPQWGDILNIQYVLYTVSPSGDALVKHDSTYDRGKHGYLIHHGNGEHILGLEEALHTMSVGGRRRAIVPLKIGYSKNGFAPIPPSFQRRKEFIDAINDGDGTVVFDIELRTIKKDPDDRGYYTDITPTDEELLRIVEEQQGVGVNDADESVRRVTVE